MISDTKAKKYVNDGRVFPLRQDEKSEYWVIDGDTGIWEVRYDKRKQSYSCNCQNIRLTPCSHQKAVMIRRKIFYEETHKEEELKKTFPIMEVRIGK